MYFYSPFWASGGVLTRSLWAAKDAQLLDRGPLDRGGSHSIEGAVAEGHSIEGAAVWSLDRVTGYAQDRDRFAAALIADVLEQARDDAQQKGGRNAAIFLASLRDDLATFAPTSPPPAPPEWPSWCEAFLQALWNGDTVGDAARSVGKCHATLMQYRRSSDSFKQAYDGLRERGMVKRAA